MKEVKKMLHAKLERHLAKPHTLLYEVSTLYIYIYILMMMMMIIIIIIIIIITNVSYHCYYLSSIVGGGVSKAAYKYPKQKSDPMNHRFISHSLFWL